MVYLQTSVFKSALIRAQRIKAVSGGYMKVGFVGTKVMD
jgi:hypothetical protein